jgi:hypothetical protein
LAWKSSLKVPFLPLGRSCPLQTILLIDLVGFDSPLQIVMAFWCTIIVSRGLSHPESLNSNKKGAKLTLLSAEGCHTLDGQDWAALPSDNISGSIFQGWKNPLMI